MARKTVVVPTVSGTEKTLQGSGHPACLRWVKSPFCNVVIGNCQKQSFLLSRHFSCGPKEAIPSLITLNDKRWSKMR